MKKIFITTTSVILSVVLAGCSIIQSESQKAQEAVSQVKEKTSQIVEKHQGEHHHGLENLIELFHKEYPHAFISEIKVENPTHPVYEVEGYDDTTVYHLTYDSDKQILTPILEDFIEEGDYYIPLDDTSLYNVNHILDVAKAQDKTAKITEWKMTAENGDDQTVVTIQTATDKKEIVVDNVTQEVLPHLEEIED